MSKIYIAVALVASSPFAAMASDNYVTKNLSKGWRALGKRSDPFDKSKIDIVQVSKADFTFRCNSINFEVGDEYSGFDSFSFTVDIQFRIDNDDPVRKKGRYSTYLNGSDMVNDERVFSAKLKSSDIDQMKSGNKLVAAGNFSGWTSKEVNLAGFTNAYELMCN